MSRRRTPKPIMPAVEANAAWAAAASLRRANAQAQPPPVLQVTSDPLLQLQNDYKQNYGDQLTQNTLTNQYVISAYNKLEERQRAEEERQRQRALYMQQQQQLQDEERRRQSMGWYGIDNFARQGGERRKSKKKNKYQKKTKSRRRIKSLRKNK